MVNNLQLGFETATKKYFEQNSSDEDGNLEYPDLKTNVFREKNQNINEITPKIQEIISKKGLPAKLVHLIGDDSAKKYQQISSAIVAKEKNDQNERASKRKHKDKVKRKKKKSKTARHSRSEDDDDSTASESAEEDEPVPAKKPKYDKKDKQKKRDLSRSSPARKVKKMKDAQQPSTSKASTSTATLTKKSPKPTIKKKHVDDVDSGSESDDESEPDETPKKMAKAKAKKSEKDSKAEKETKNKSPKTSKRESKPIQPETDVNDSPMPSTSKASSKKRTKLDVKKLEVKKSVPVANTADDDDADMPSTQLDDTSDLDTPLSPVPPPTQKARTKTIKETKKTQKSKSDVPKTNELKSNTKLKKHSKDDSGSGKKVKKVEKTNRKECKVKKNKSTNKKIEQVEHDVPEWMKRSPSPFYSSSRSSTPPRFTVDLHKKYSQSASLFSPEKDEPKPSTSGISNMHVDASSCSSRSRSPSPLHTRYSSMESLDSMDDDDNIDSRGARPTTPDVKIKDKFDLIKERRSRNNDIKWNQVVKDAEKIRGNQKAANVVASTSGLVPEKNQKLKETIEKLKQKNKQSKQSTVILDKIFNADASSKDNDKNLIDKLREACGSSSSTPKEAKPLGKKKSEKASKLTPTTTSAGPSTPCNIDEYNFIDESTTKSPQKKKEKGVKKSEKPAKAGKSTKTEKAGKTEKAKAAKATKSEEPPKLDKPPKTEKAAKAKVEKPVKAGKSTKVEKPGKVEKAAKATKTPKSQPKAEKSKSPKTDKAPDVDNADENRNPPVANSTKKSNKTNMAALELETEQTLKDISRWLEHTPRLPDFNSASNSPIRFQMDDFDNVPKIDVTDFQPPIPAEDASTPRQSPSKLPSSSSAATAATAATANVQPPLSSPPEKSTTDFSVLKDSTSAFLLPTPSQPTPTQPKQTIQLTGIPPPPGPHKQPKESKKKSLKEKISGAPTPKRKDVHRTIDRLQPGKTKGNLIGSICNKQEEAKDVNNSAIITKPKEVKNSLMQETNEEGPKLSLGTVLDTDGFGLGLQYNFIDDLDAVRGKKMKCHLDRKSKLNDIPNSNLFAADLHLSDEGSRDKDSDDMELEEIITSTEMLAKEQAIKDIEEKEKLIPKKPEAKVVEAPAEEKSGTPNLSAWFKAFGAPKKPKKADEEDSKKEEKHNDDNKALNVTSTATTNTEPTSSAPLPGRRTRKASTGSTISERSSFSQDPDSPRIGIDERIGGTYPAPYPSPLGASPIMASPRDDIPKPTSPYAMNGAIKVGFYQDTTTKSSPEKSCSPREPNSPYSNYAQHLYTSAPGQVAAAYGNYSTPTEPTQTATLGFNNKNKTPSYFDQYKQPRSQESDYSSMSPNPNSPYQNQQQSPYHQPNSPYHQQQLSPYPQMSPQAQPQPPAPQQQPQSQPQPITDSSYPQPNSPYQNQQLSPFPQSNSPHASYQANQPQSQSQPPPSQQQAEPSTPYPANPASPYSTDANSPYSQPSHSPMFPNPNSPKPQTSPQSQTVQQPVDPSPQPNVANQNWSNQQNAHLSSVGQQQQPHESKTNATIQQQQQEHQPLSHPQQSQHGYLNYANQYSASMQIPMPSANHANTKPINDPNANQRDLFNIGGYPNQTVMAAEKHDLSKGADKPLDISVTNARLLETPKPVYSANASKAADASVKHQQPQMFDPLYGYNKNMVHKSYDMTASKASDMFNRAVAFGYTTPNAAHSASNKPAESGAPELTDLSKMTPSAYQHQSKTAASTDLMSLGYQRPPDSAPVNASTAAAHHVNYGQHTTTAHMQQAQQHGYPQTSQQQQQHSMPSYSNPMAAAPQPHQQQQQQSAAPNASNAAKPSDMNLQQRYDMSRQGHMPHAAHGNLDLSGYKSAQYMGMPMMDDPNLMGLPAAAANYYQKDIGAPAHMYNKNIAQATNIGSLQQMLNTPSIANAYCATREQANAAANYQRMQASAGSQHPTSEACAMNQQVPVAPPPVNEPKKRGRKKKNAAAAAAPAPAPADAIQNQMMQQQQQVQQAHNQQQQMPPHPVAAHQQQQGFQSYAGLKTSSSSSAAPASSAKGASDTNAISLKTANAAAAMVPGSAFNFGPTGSALGIYGENTPYLDEYRGTGNSYFLAQAHRSTPDTPGDKNANAAPPPSYHQFLPSPAARPTYPFMNPTLEANSPLYQQYLRQEEYRQAHMMLNQGLLGHSAPHAYQPGYHPALGMHKPYDAMNSMNRPPWFQ